MSKILKPQSTPRAQRLLVLLTLCSLCPLWFKNSALAQTKPATTAPKKPTLAVLPFIPLSGDTKEKDLADRMRFAVSQKLSSDTNAIAANAPFDRLDNVKVDQLISALQISFAKSLPDDDEFQKLLATLDTDFTILGTLKHRDLTLYTGTTKTKTATATIPPDNTSPKLTVEKLLTDLTSTTFAHIRDTEVDHSDPKAEARFAARPNLVPDPGFERAALDHKPSAADWEVLLAAEHDPPLLLTAADIPNLAQDRVAVIPIAAIPSFTPPATKNSEPISNNYALIMRMSKAVAESNGLACESTWIPVEANKKYRFTALYHSNGPTARLFLKGFAEKPDQFSDPKNPESSRREYYRAQILPRNANPRAAWDLIEMDFTPSSLKPTDPKIQWLRIDLFIYLTPGDIFFDNITLKKLDE